MRWLRTAIAADAMFVVLIGLAVFAVDPRGDFPLDDDWNFALTTWHWADTGELVYSRFTAMTLKTQIVWGALWTKLFGASFEVLRASSLFLFFVSVVVFHRWLRDLELPPRVATLATLAFAAHPVIFWSAFTYMTQVPFLLLSIVALRCFDIGIRRDDRRWIGAACVAVVAAFFLRQTGVVLVVAPLVTIWRRRHTLRNAARLAAVAAAPLAIFTLLFVATDWLSGYPGQILEHFKVWQVSPAELPDRAVRLATYYTFYNFQNAALFLLPLTLAFALSARVERRAERIVGAVLPGAGFCLALHMINRGFPMPYWSLFARFDVHPGNVLVNFGLGPQTLPDLWVWNMEPPFPLSVNGSYLLTIVSGMLGGVALWSLILAWRQAPALSEKQGVTAELMVAHAVAATAALFVSGIYFDRYSVDSLWTLAIVLPLLTDWTRVRTRWAAVGAVAVVGAFSILATQEYLRWNRARWEALGDLRKSGVRLEQIDGGYEVNQYLIGGFDGPVHLQKYGFSVVDNEYVIAFNRVPGYRVVGKYGFESFLGLRRGTVHALRRDDRRGHDPR